MRYAPIAIVLVILMGCANGPKTNVNSAPAVTSATSSERGEIDRMETTLRSNINLWRQALSSKSGYAKASDSFKEDKNIKPLYAAAARSINIYIEAYVLELDSGSPNPANLHQLAEKTDQAVQDFVRYVDRNSGNAAVNWIAVAPILKDVFTAIYDKYRQWKDKNQQAAAAQLATFKASLNALKVKESYDEA